MTIRKAIIPVAGFGTRLLPVTKAIPKAMLPLVDKPVIHYLVEEAVASGIQEIAIIIGTEQREIENYFKRSAKLEKHLTKIGRYDLLEAIENISKLAHISYIKQNYPRGLGHAILCAKDFIGRDEAFAIMLGDDLIYSSKEPCLKQLIKTHTECQGNVIGAMYVEQELISLHGIIRGIEVENRLFKVSDLIEKPDIEKAPSNLAIMGRYIIYNDIFNILEETKPGKGGEIQLTDALRILSRTQDVYAYILEGIRYDVGNVLGYMIANTDFAMDQKEIGENFKKHLLDLCKKNFPSSS